MALAIPAGDWIEDFFKSWVDTSACCGFVEVFSAGFPGAATGGPGTEGAGGPGAEGALNPGTLNTSSLDIVFVGMVLSTIWLTYKLSKYLKSFSKVLLF